MSLKNYVAADDYRIRGEKLVLYATVGVLVVVVTVLPPPPVFLVALLIAVGIVGFVVKIQQGQLLGHCVKVSEHQLPEVYKAANAASDRLSMRMPDVFVRQDPVINAYALGFLGKKSVVLHSAAVESMDSDELTSILGHEFSHIKCGHTIWQVITTSPKGIGVPIISAIFGYVFLFWSRKAEYTSDRGAVLASRNFKATISALAKAAVGKQLFEKLSIDQLFQQKTDVDRDGVSRLSESLSTHPYIVKRIHALRHFYESETYRQLTTH
jgi:Zn-dependent protease with chaperone function